jgi:hypothetical protein
VVISAVRSDTRRSRTRCSAWTSDCAWLFTSTNRIVGRVTASAIALRHSSSLFCAFTYGRATSPSRWPRSRCRDGVRRDPVSDRPAARGTCVGMAHQREQTRQMTRVDVCPDASQAMSSSASSRSVRRFGSRHSRPRTEFPCSAPQRDGKSLQNARQLAKVGYDDECRGRANLYCDAAKSNG